MKKCPICENKVKEIIYGFPSQEFNEDDYILGGCLLLGVNPRYYCPKCDVYYDKDLKKIGSEEEDNEE